MFKKFTTGVKERKMKKTLMVASFILLLGGCTQEVQNKIKRGIQNWTGTDGVLEVYAGEKLIMRFIRVDKLSTAKGTEDGGIRPYRYGYGFIDKNRNFKVDTDEKRVYFEFSNYSGGQYIFYENPY